jgi:hypothetical protein
MRVRTSSAVGALPAWKVATASALGLPLFGLLHLVLPGLHLDPGRAPAGLATAPSGPPRLYFTWHQNIYLAYLLTRLCRELRGVVWLTHDRLRALWGSLPPTWWGMPIFVFRLGAAESRITQIAEAFPEASPMLVFPDSGGPYFRIKPGFVRLGRTIGAELVPLGIDISRRFAVDRRAGHLLPLPGGILRYRVGAPVPLPPNESDPERRLTADVAGCEAALAAVSAAARAAPIVTNA